MNAAAGERTTELLKQLDGEVEALTDSAAWQRYLTMQARLHKYSFGNCLLIGAQRPDATRVAGYQAWRELGRQVRKGESGIRIMVPFVYRKREAAENEAGEASEAYVRFGTGHVFDIAQTDGAEIGGTWGYVQGDASAATAGLAQLEAYAQSLGYTVTRETADGNARGHTAFKTKSIVLAADQDVVNSAATLAHELAHVLLHEGITDYHANRGLYEVEAESVAYVVVTGLGLDASSCSLPYVANWAGGSDAKAVRTLGEHVHKAASTLLAQVDSSVREVAA
jgi:antirestriction protein ArdC